jgi:hypothetical protein
MNNTSIRAESHRIENLDLPARAFIYVPAWVACRFQHPILRGQFDA